jgi:2-hydroxychromene-2-carboxylate isomerase
VETRPVFYFDFNSPFAYLAAERIDDLIPDADWRPIAFPFILGRDGRLEEAMRRDFEAVREEVSGRAAERGLPPLDPPQGWPIEIWSLTPLRAALYADERGRLREFAHAAFRKVFAEGRPLSETGNLHDAAREAGLEPAEVDEAVERPDIKERLKDQTDEAFERGVRGIPTVAIGDELFWGDDRLDEAAAAISR